jgi:LysM repeat protein
MGTSWARSVAWFNTRPCQGRDRRFKSGRARHFCLGRRRICPIMNQNWLKDLLKKIKVNESTISTLLGILVILVVGILIFNYFRNVSQPGEEISSPTPKEEVKLVEEEGKLYPEALPKTHRVAEGEHLWAIAEKYYGSGYNWVNIARENNLANPNHLLVGQELTIPKEAVIKPSVEEPVFEKTIEKSQYVVQKGDHLWGIAVRAYGDGYRWVEIARENNLKNPNLIHPGNQLALPR